MSGSSSISSAGKQEESKSPPDGTPSTVTTSSSVSGGATTATSTSTATTTTTTTTSLSSSSTSLRQKTPSTPSIHRWFAALHRGQALTQSSDGSTSLAPGPSNSTSTYYTPPPPAPETPEDEADEEEEPQATNNNEAPLLPLPTTTTTTTEEAEAGGDSTSHAAHAAAALPNPLGDSSPSTDGFSSSNTSDGLSDDHHDPSSSPTSLYHLTGAIADTAAPLPGTALTTNTTTVTPMPANTSATPAPAPLLTAAAAAPLEDVDDSGLNPDGTSKSSSKGRRRRRRRSAVPSLRRLAIMTVAAQLDTHLPTILTQAPLSDDVLARLLRYMASVGMITATHLPAFRSVVRSISLSTPPYNDRVNDAWIALLAGAPLLQHLSLSTVSRITDAALGTLSTVPNLVALELEHTSITDAGLSALTGNPLPSTSPTDLAASAAAAANSAAILSAAAAASAQTAATNSPSWVSGIVQAFSSLTAKPTKIVRAALQPSGEPPMAPDLTEDELEPHNSVADDSEEDQGLSLNPSKLTPAAPMARRRRKAANLRPRSAVLGKRKPLPRRSALTTKPSSPPSSSSSNPPSSGSDAEPPAPQKEAVDQHSSDSALIPSALATNFTSRAPFTQPTSPPSLQELSLRGCSGVTSAGIAALGRAMPQLKVLRLDGTNINHDAIPIIGSSFSQLRELTMANTIVGLGQLDALAQLKHLAVLALDSTGTTDTSLAGLAGLASLRVLSLSTNPFGDGGLRFLAALTGLLHLDLTQTAVTDASVPLLGSAFPHLGFLGLYHTKITAAALSAENAPIHLTIAKNGTIAGEVAALIAYGTTRAKLGCDIVKALSTMAFVPEAKQAIGARGGIAAIRATLAAHVSNADVQIRCLGLLWSLALDNVNRAAIAAKGGIDQIVTSLKTHIKNHRVAHAACGLLWNMTVEEAIQDSIVAAKGIDTILGAMDAHPKQQDVLTNATAILWNISLRRHQEIMVKANVLPRLIRAMQTHPGARDLIRNGTAVIWNVATKKENLATIAAYNGLQTLLSILERWQHDEELVIKAGGALMLLPLDTSNRTRLANLGAAAKVIHVIRQHNTNPRVLFQLFGVLWNLSPETRVQDQIVGTGGIRNLLDAVALFRADAQLMVRVTGVLWNISITRANQAAIMAESGATAMISVLRAHTNNTPIVMNSTSVLWNLATSVEHKDVLVPLLLQDMLALPFSPVAKTNPNVVRNIFAILWNLVQVPAGRDAFPLTHLRIFIAPLCEQVMPLHATQAAGALHELAKSPAHAEAITASGGVLAIHNSLMVAPQNISLLMNAMGALLYLIPNPSHPNLLTILHLLTASLTQPGRPIPIGRNSAAPQPDPSVPLSAPGHVFDNPIWTARQLTAAKTLALLACEPTIGPAIVNHGLVDVLCTLLNHPSTHIVVAVADTMGNIASHGGDGLAALLTPTTVQLLTGLCSSPHRDVSFMALWALAALCPTPQQADPATAPALLSTEDKTRYLKVHPTGIEARNDTPYLESVSGSVAVTSGKWYFECEAVVAEFLQLGWTSVSGPFEPAEGHGVGDSPFSWAYDPLRRLKWHDRKESQYGLPLAAGDVIGVILDLDDGAIGGSLRFTHNGSDCGQAFTGLATTAFLDGGLVPAVSLATSQHVKFNFGTAPWSFQPPTDQFKGYALARGQSHAGRRPVRGYSPLGTDSS